MPEEREDKRSKMERINAFHGRIQNHAQAKNKSEFVLLDPHRDPNRNRKRTKTSWLP